MKKIYLGLIILLIAILAPINSKAADTASVTITAPGEAEIRDEIEVIINVTGTSTGVQGVQGTLKYDKDVLEYQSKEIKKDNWFVSGYNNDTGVFLAELTDSGMKDNSSYIYNLEKIISFKFKVKDTAELGNTEMTVSNIVTVGATTEEGKVSSNINIVEKTKDNNTEDNTTGDDSTDKNTTGNDTNTGENSNQSSSNNNNTENKGDSTIADKEMPNTGTKSIIALSIVILFVTIIVSYKGYEKYRGI